MIRLNFCKNLCGAEGEFCLDISAEIKQGERVSIFGKSGAGKSTILKVLAGLEGIDKGAVECEGRVWNNQNCIFPPQQRKIGLVFQNHALFPNLNVYENISYAKNSNPTRVKRLVEIMELGAIVHHYPSKLSGGQAQRVALARALASEPKILLLDEPFSALDMQIRSKLLDEILLLHQEFLFTLILVSHSMEEVMRLSQRILFLENGVIQKEQNIGEISHEGEAKVLEYQQNTQGLQVKMLWKDQVIYCQIPI